MSGELVRITERHALEILAPRAIDVSDAAALGVYSISSPEELPEELKGNRYAETGSGLIFPWRSPSGEVVPQFRPDEPAANDDGDPVKYVFPGGQRMVLNELRADPSRANDGPVLLTEGTCQSIAASVYAPDGWAVFGLSGCWNWRLGDTTVAIPDLMVMENRQVVICLDADAVTNRNVYDAGMALKEALLAEGADGVTFTRLAGAGKRAGLDDVLGTRPADKRPLYVRRLIDSARERPADRPPAASRSGVKKKLTVKSLPGRPMIVVSEDRFIVIGQIVSALADKWAGSELFCYGGILARRTGVRVEPVHKDAFGNLVAEASQCVTAKGEYAWPDSQSMGAALARAGDFPRLDRIAEMPFVRDDGSICQTPGYDEATASFLVLDETVERVAVPDDPTPEDVAGAVKLLRDEWLGDFMDAMPADADRANCLALVLTPLIRGLVPLAPMAVIDGLQMGVGKNLLADLIAILATGRVAKPLPYSGDDEETRKVITSTFRTGAELFVFDEAHNIGGPQLARSLTSATYSDRVLGVSQMAEFPNRVTWMALGNNVAVHGDLARRVYRIRLSPAVADPQDRSADSFRHPDVKGWTVEHRAELIAAGLTLVRAWMNGDRRTSDAGRKFGSFEAWGGMVGGILEASGVAGFLDNLTTWRSESDFDSSYWSDHFGWLRDRFGSAEFTVAEVVTTMRRAREGSVEHPPRLEDHTVTGYNRLLGQAYGRVRGRTFTGLTLVKVTERSTHGQRWRVVGDGDGDSSDRSDRSPDPAPTSNLAYDVYTRESSSYGEVAIYPNYPDYPSGSAAAALSSLATEANEVPAPVCPDCDGPEELVPGTHWYACRSCTPSTFVVP